MMCFLRERYNELLIYLNAKDTSDYILNLIIYYKYDHDNSGIKEADKNFGKISCNWISFDSFCLSLENKCWIL